MLRMVCPLRKPDWVTGPLHNASRPVPTACSVLARPAASSIASDTAGNAAAIRVKGDSEVGLVISELEIQEGNGAPARNECE